MKSSTLILPRFSSSLVREANEQELFLELTRPFSEIIITVFQAITISVDS